MARPKKCLDDMRYDELVIYCIKKDRIIKFLQDWVLIPQKMKCSKCRSQMKLFRKQDCQSGYGWRCKKKCGSKRSIYDFSLFSECRIDFLKFIKFAYLLFHDDIGPKKAIFELILSRESYYYYKKKLESVMIKDYILHKSKIGGTGSEVQIDESLFNRRKYNNGWLKKSLWVFGGIEVGTNRCFFYEVNKVPKILYRH
ncbi:hypothetical protein DMUE_5536 [Dictyocoela muelleri]|nr:hypothetical protein DMUE_5536 [Dictyocoela muelleri]